ncbi:hypothetical protein CcaverHIS002_0309080 [Cutaneotrichosporon cavernicola]|uniref:SH3 domain-containing protein n=1 Tax=Cutaneotrichosporon cavernicola TaxID=279322 RepID=A0AA48IH32_9TREE|nr:uncharacterized protein CcaverHIS019_0308930 [Cutaneotrichosporon cavernicola]BEI83040.1 hypothetical protein CcaverHIS002_0309080 [Cutaneotrichosporon cavernicola]BEI90823.1 hypothetical protein CcaverHIS019_0308930 [Cutaneotrichosporon cavernicola]BEI98602.1 hypothetical protein CcaverHIS631_0309010 [Cutaneotrichosporon cavernicola]
MPRNPPIRRLGAFAVAAAIIAPFATAASTPAPNDLPSVNFSKMGRVVFGGEFAGLDWFTSQSPFAVRAADNGTIVSYSATADTLVMRADDGTVTPIGATNDGGRISSMCWSNDGILYVGGEFNQFGGINANSVVSYSPSQAKFSAMGTGIAGPVETLYCDDADHDVWAGGFFSAPESLGNVGRWSTETSAWAAVPFGGLNGRVRAISSSLDGGSLYFGGEFTTQFADNSNTTARTMASVSIAPPNTITTGDSGYLVPVTIPAAASEFGGLHINAAPATNQDQYNNADSIVCPNTGPWLARDASVATVNILGYSYLTGSGIRMSNGLVGGRGTTSFTVTTLPDNTVLTLKYTDPVTREIKTCSKNCPLSVDPNVHAQDFLFEGGSRALTGFNIVLDSWQGAGAGVNYIQLLSNGAYASAVSSNNQGFCGPSNSSIHTIGDWDNANAPSNISGTEQGYMSSTVPVNSPSDTSITLYPWVGSAGFYKIYLIIPGCNNIGDCASRTTVDVAIFPTEGGTPYTATINQRVTEDTEVLIYDGLVDASNTTFNPTIRVALPNDPAKVGSSNYVVVAAGVQMQLTGLSTGQESSPGSSSSVSGGASGSQTGAPAPVTTVVGQSTVVVTPTGTQPLTTVIGGSTVIITPTATLASSASSVTSSGSIIPAPTSSGVRTAFGVYEYVRSSRNLNAINALLPNQTETGVTRLGFSLDVNNNQTAARDFQVTTIVPADNLVLVGGSFKTRDWSNIASVDKDSGIITPLAGQGLNGAVAAAVTVGQYVYVGGQFTSTVNGGDQLNRLARYDVGGKKWEAVEEGVDGPVTDIVPFKDGLLIVGNFSNVLASNGSTPTGGYALYNTSTSKWFNSGIVYGTATAAAGTDTNAYFGGRIRGASRNAVNGVASLSSKDGIGHISNLEGVAFSNQGSAPAPTNPTRRSLTARWLSRIHQGLVERQAAAQAAPYSEEPVVAPASLAGTYWTNSSNANTMVTIMGGNFSQGTGDNLISGVAFQSNGALTGPPNPVSGVVRALEVHKDMLYIGGSGVSVTGKGSSFLALNLKTNSWKEPMPPTLSAGSNTTVNVNAIKAQIGADIIIVGGNFAQAGDLPCPVICQWNAAKTQWTRVGNNAPSAGEVKSLAFNNNSTLVAGGSFVIGGKNVYAARYTFNDSGANGAWEPLDGLPGPVQSIVMNDHNASNIFAAGFDASTAKPYLQHWNGGAWTEQNSSLLMDGTSIENLAFVPLSKEHTARGSIENNRMLMATGNVFLAGQGNVSSALYDGSQWYPYLVGSSPTGDMGTGSSLFWSESNFSFSLSSHPYLARGLVVLVAMAIATGLILLIVLLILLVAFCFRRQDRKRRPAQDMYEKDEARSEVSSTHNLIHSHVQTALEQSFAPAQYAPGHHPGAAMAAAGAAGVGAGAYAQHRAAESSDSHYLDAVEYSQPVEAEEYGAAGSWEGSDEGRETVMRYDFCGPELQSGELSMKAGQRVIVLDDEQSDEWWYARDPATGRQGVVPATYVL